MNLRDNARRDDTHCLATPPSLYEKTCAYRRGADVTVITADAPEQDSPARRIGSARNYLMCPPEHFAVSYAINPWMDPERPVDAARAMAQWEALRETYVRLGHQVQLI